MSGGFFRGTSADQDTRFSNKQAKLLKSQKFPQELDHLVDMSKVNMDVIRPWIATRATELLGFEDEVLINFVYGLLDVKVVDGKKIQIQLTGFMEKNTGKFMKELWTLLLSAQNNVSGVPQQFLDAKEEEQRKKKEENDKISQEIQKRKERAARDLEREKLARMEVENGDPNSHKTGTDILSRPRDSSGQPGEERKEEENHSHKTRNGHSISPYETNTSPQSQQSSHSAARSSSKSGSSYGSYLKEGYKSRSPSMYSQSPRHSISPRRRNYSPVRQSLSPVRKYRSPHRHPTSRSPIRRRSPPSRRKSISRSRNRYPSPYWRRSHAQRSPHMYRRSPSPLHRRSPSPVRRRSPPLRRRSPFSVHRRSYSPAQHRSPIQPQRRSPSPSRHQSLVRHGSPSPARYGSISPIRRRLPFPSSPKCRRETPPQSPVRQHVGSYNSSRQRNRSPSPHRTQSPLNRRNSKLHNNFVVRGKSGRPYDEGPERRFPIHHNLVREPANYVGSDKSPSHSKFQKGKIMSSRKLSRSVSSSRSPVVRRGGSISHNESSETSREQERSPCRRDVDHHINECPRNQNTLPRPDRESSHVNENSGDAISLDRSIVTQLPTTRHPVKSEIQSDTGDRQKGKAQQGLQSSVDIEYGPGGARRERNMLDDVKLFSHDRSPRESEYKERTRRGVAPNAICNLQSISKGTEHEESRHEREHGKRAKRKFDNDHLNSNLSDSDDAQNIVKQLHKRLDNSKRDISESSESDSQIDDKKEAKRKKKEDKRLRKEEKRRRREERRRRRSERHAAKQKLKTTDALIPHSDFEKHLSEADDSDGDAYPRKNSIKINVKEAETEQKRLEIELRRKALESLRAKKAIND